MLVEEGGTEYTRLLTCPYTYTKALHCCSFVTVLVALLLSVENTLTPGEGVRILLVPEWENERRLGWRRCALAFLVFFYRLTLSFFFLFLRRGYSMRRNACDARSLGPVVAFFRFEGEIESNERKETTLEYWEYWERWKYQKKKYTEVRNENFTYIASVKGWGRISTFDYLMRRQMLTWIPRWLVAREELLYATLPLYRSLNMVILWAHSAPDTISYNLCIYMHILVVCAYSVWAGQSSPMAWLFTEIQGFLETTEILFPKWSFAFPWEANRCAMHTGGRRHVVVTWRE